MTHAQLVRGDIERIVVDAAGQPVATLAAGPPSGPPVLLVPGYTGSKEDFAALLAPVAAAGFRIVAMDQPGQHESPGLPERDDYRPDRLGRVVRDVARGLGPEVRLLGHSFGGLVSRAAVIAEPDLFASLVLLCSGPAQLEGVRRLRIEQMEPVLSSTGLTGVYAAMQAMSLEDPAYVAPPAELAEFLERRFLGGSPTMLQGMGDALRLEPDRVSELAAVGLPLLVAHGEGDDAWPPELQRTMATRLGARYEVIAGAAHSPAVENPEATVRVLLDFWA